MTASIDLALALVREHHGSQLALEVAKRLVVVAQRQGGQSQFSPYLSTPADPESPVARIQEHVLANIAERHTLQSLAALVDMSTRNLTRHFVQETEITPHEFVLRARIDAARMVLESTDLPLKTVAFDCGFGLCGVPDLLIAGGAGVPAFFTRTGAYEVAGPEILKRERRNVPTPGEGDAAFNQ